MTYMDMAFTGTLDTALDGLAPDSGGGTFATTESGATNTLKLDGIGAVYKPGTFVGSYWWSTTIPAADYQADLVIDIKSVLASDLVILDARATGTLYQNAYRVIVNQAGTVTLDKLVSNVSTALGTSTVTLTAGTTHTLSIRVLGNQISALWDGSVIIGPITDTAYSAAGQVGFRTGNNSVAGQTVSTGMHLSRITVGELVPSNTVAPTISGTRVEGQTLSTTDGTWSGSPTSYAYQWTRDGSNISGATSNNYTLVTADVGHAVACKITATNANGASVPVSSNSLNIVAEMVGTDISFNLAAGGGLGGSPGAAITSPSSVYDPVTFSEAQAGDIEYRAVYLKNNHAVRTLNSAVVWIASQTTSPTTDLAVGVAPESAGSDVTAVANEGVPPVGVTFSAPSTEGAAVSLGALGPGQSRGLWLRWTVLPGTAELPADTTTLGWSGTPA